MAESIENDAQAGIELSDSDIPKDAESQQGSDNEKWSPTFGVFCVIGVLMLLALLSAIDATAVAAGLAVITAELKGTSTQAMWSNSAFLLTSAVFQPIIGSFSEIFGRRPLAIITVIFFTVGSIMCAVSHDFTLLIAGRSVQGVGGGGCLVLSEIIISDLIPLRERGKYYGFLGAMWAIGTVVGPLLGGGFAANATWRWIFYFNLPLCGISLVAIALYLNLHLERSSFKEKMEKIDWVGLVLFTASNTSLLLGISFGGTMFPWKSWHTLVPLILGAAGCFAVGIYEYYVPKVPIVNTKVFCNLSASIGFFQVVLHGLILYLLIYFLPLYYQASKNYSAITSAVALLPESLTIAPSSIAAGVTVAITGRYLFVGYIGWVLTTFGMGLLVLLNYKSTVGDFIGINIPVGLGIGVAFVVLNNNVMSPNPPERHGQAAAVLSFLRTLGQAFGAAIGGSVFSNQMASQVGKHPELSAYSNANNAIALVEVIRHLPESPTKTLLKKCVDNSVHIIFYVGLAFSAACLLSLLAVKEYSLDVNLVSSQAVKEKRGKPSTPNESSTPSVVDAEKSEHQS